MIPWCNTGNEGSILGKDYLSSFDAPWSEWSWINLLSKQILNPFLNLRIQSWAAPKKRKLIQNQSMNKELKIVRYFVLSLFEAKPVKGSLWKNYNCARQEKIMYCLWFSTIFYFPAFRFDMDFIIYKKGLKYL